LGIRRVRPDFENSEAEQPGGDVRCSVRLSAPQTLANGFRNYDRFSVTLQDGADTKPWFDREVLRSGAVVGVLPVDVVRRELVLTRQFRLGGHLATDRGDMLEIVAGRVDPGERPEDAARRECNEEIGTWPVALMRLFEFCPAPALSDELMTLFVAHIDASRVSARGGLAHENEEIAVVRCSIGEAMRVLESGGVHSGPTILALQWLAQHFGK
jgi:ADP-ribose pyrophosphatase